MKKFLASLLGILFALSAAHFPAVSAEKSLGDDPGAEASEGGRGAYTYLAFTWGYTVGAPPGTPEDMADTSRMIQMLMPGSAMPAALQLPEDCGEPEDYSFKGVMITVDTPIGVERDGPYVTIADLPDFIVSRHVEIVGDVLYGNLTEVGEDYVTLDIYGDFAAGSEDRVRRFTVTEDTLIFLIDEPRLKPWDGAVIIGTPGGEALAIHLSRG